MSTNISVSNIAWNSSNDERIAVFLQRNGIKNIDIALGKYFKDVSAVRKEDLRKIKKFWNSFGISLFGMQSLLFGTERMNLFGNSEIRSDMLSHLKKVANFASVLGIQFITFGSPKNRDCSGLSSREIMDKALSFFWEFGNIAKEFDLTICLEANPKIYSCNFLTATEDCFNFLLELNHPNVLLQLDTGTIIANGEKPKDFLNYSDLIGHIHLSKPYLSPWSLIETNLPSDLFFELNKLKREVLTLEMISSSEDLEEHEIANSITFLKNHLA